MATRTRTKAIPATVVYAKSTTNVKTEHGFPVHLEQGEPWGSDDPIVQAYPEAFSSLPLVRDHYGGWRVLDD